MRRPVTTWTPVAATLVAATLIATLSLAGCASKRRAPTAPIKHSGFLDDYAVLQPGEHGKTRLAYHNPDARWADYDKIIFEPVAIWRGGKSSLDEIPEEDLYRLAHDLHHTLRSKLEQHYEMVDQPGPGVMRIRLALTDAEESDRVLDIFTTVVPHARTVSDSHYLAAGTQAFVRGASIEGQITDAQTGELLLAAMDTSMAGSLEGSDDSWSDVHQAFEHWADRVSRRLDEARRGER